MSEELHREASNYVKNMAEIKLRLEIFFVIALSFLLCRAARNNSALTSESEGEVKIW